MRRGISFPFLTLAMVSGALLLSALPAGAAAAEPPAPAVATAPAAQATPAIAPDGARLYMRCAACHTATGAGVPGTYPPLGANIRILAAEPAGRNYLVLAISRGLMGPLTIDGKTYRGVMPAQSGLDDAAIAAVLNHVGGMIAGSGPSFAPFSAEEVTAARSGSSTLTAAMVAKRRADLARP